MDVIFVVLVSGFGQISILSLVRDEAVIGIDECILKVIQ